MWRCSSPRRCWASVPSTASPAAAAAEVVVSGPAAGAVVSSPTPVTGSAASPSGVVSVGVAALRPSDNLWLQPTGGFAPVEAFWPATLASPGQATTTWSVTLPLPPGEVVVVARAVAADGTSADAVTSFRVATRPMLTLQLGRAMLGQSSQCQPIPGQPTIFDVAGELRARGLFAVGVVVPDRTDDVAVQCENGNLYPSWTDYGAAARRVRLVVREQRPAPARPPAAQPERADRRVVRLARRRSPHGATTAPGACSDRTPTRSPTPSPPTCSTGASPSPACTRRGITEQQRLTAPYYERVRVAGGGSGAGYDPPAEVLARHRHSRRRRLAEPGLLQVRGRPARRSGSPQWDCTSPDPARHWTTDDEVYCWTDYLAILDGLAPLQLEVVDPATVAERWGRVPSVQVARFTVPATASTSAPTVGVSFSAYESGDFWLVANGSCAGSGQVVAGGQLPLGERPGRRRSRRGAAGRHRRAPPVPAQRLRSGGYGGQLAQPDGLTRRRADRSTGAAYQVSQCTSSSTSRRGAGLKSVPIV